MHILCTICSDLVNQAESIYVTKCGHIFHQHCLAQWIERSKSCPQCRNKVTEKCMFRVYPTVSNDSTGDDAATLQSRLDDVQLQLRQQKSTSKEQDDRLAALSTDLKRNEDLLRSYEKKLVSRDSAVQALKDQLEYVKIQNKEVTKLKEDNEMLQKNVQTLNGLQKVLNATADDVENMLRGYTDLKTIAIFATALKRALCESESKKNECRDKLHSTKQELSAEKRLVADLQATIMHLEDRLHNTQRKYEATKRIAEVANNSIAVQPAKMARQSHSFDLNTAILGDSCDSLTNLVNNIESADSPYFHLKQSSAALSALYVDTNKQLNCSPKKMSRTEQFHREQRAEDPSSIFYKRNPIISDPNIYISGRDMSYDGLGGHSKLDTFPKPKPKMKSLIPKLSAKHKLKRPSLPSGSQDIGKFMERLNHPF